ncbi:MYXO-CTERM sorting domain-containing protein [Nannocystis punicea]|uniref:MYXO-CTERM sorting domain-containing protein n=1 Tax=Nannocystis punicea TaxID=2995304 RepID=A0ABY7HAD3_9BACT|nr:MYXO-CTERM sorting domain-containing protein [Nannocystis poenicansa]WAS96203.1 MYXO-CTERM sorting domain-containing protein [Nannocystis poenicansa]
MRAALVLLFVSPLGLLATTAHADALPDPDPYMACEEQELGSACFSELGDGICVEMDCPSNPGQKCGYCDPNATATTSAGTTDTGTTGGSAGTTGDTSGGAVGATDASSSGSDGGTSDGTSPKKEEGCGCRSDASPGAALGLLGLVGLLRRRRR